jgi:hypothetical protein
MKKVETKQEKKKSGFRKRKLLNDKVSSQDLQNRKLSGDLDEDTLVVVSLT